MYGKVRRIEFDGASDAYVKCVQGAIDNPEAVVTVELTTVLTEQANALADAAVARCEGADLGPAFVALSVFMSALRRGLATKRLAAVVEAEERAIVGHLTHYGNGKHKDAIAAADAALVAARGLHKRVRFNDEPKTEKRRAKR